MVLMCTQRHMLVARMERHWIWPLHQNVNVNEQNCQIWTRLMIVLTRFDVVVRKFLGSKMGLFRWLRTIWWWTEASVTIIQFQSWYLNYAAESIQTFCKMKNKICMWIQWNPCFEFKKTGRMKWIFGPILSLFVYAYLFLTQNVPETVTTLLKYFSCSCFHINLYFRIYSSNSEILFYFSKLIESQRVYFGHFELWPYIIVSQSFWGQITIPCKFMANIFHPMRKNSNFQNFCIFFIRGHSTNELSTTN